MAPAIPWKNDHDSPLRLYAYGGKAKRVSYSTSHAETLSAVNGLETSGMVATRLTEMWLPNCRALLVPPARPQKRSLARSKPREGKKQRLLKGNGRQSRFLHLKLRSRPIRIRVWKTSIHSAISFGVEAQGLAPQRLRTLRQQLARDGGLQKKGSVDS